MYKGFSFALSLTFAAISLCACVQLSPTSNQKLVEQYLIGRPLEVATAYFGKPDSVKKIGEVTRVGWANMSNYTTQHYIPGTPYTVSYWNPYTMRFEYKTEYTEPRAYTVNHHSSSLTLTEFRKGKMEGISWKRYDSDGMADTYTDTNVFASQPAMMALIKAPTVNLKFFKRYEKSNAQVFTQPESYELAALQAAKYDRVDVLEYLITEKKINLDAVHDTWAHGEGYDYVLTQASVREIIRDRNNKKVIEMLQKHGITL